MNVKEFNIKLSNYIDSNVNSRMYVKYLFSLEDIKNAFETERKIIIDFKNITFISRSAFHELISVINNQKPKFVFINMNKNIDELFTLIYQSIKNPVRKFPNTFVRKEVKTVEDLESSFSLIWSILILNNLRKVYSF